MPLCFLINGSKYCSNLKLLKDVWVSSFLFFSFSQYVLTKKEKKNRKKKEYLAVLFVLICDLFVATKRGIQQFLPS